MIVGKKRGNRASRIVESYKDDVSIQVTIPNPPHSLIYKFTLDESVDPHVSKTSDKEEMHREGKGRLCSSNSTFTLSSISLRLLRCTLYALLVIE